MEVRVTGHNFEKDHPILHASGIGLPPNFEDCVNRIILESVRNVPIFKGEL